MDSRMKPVCNSTALWAPAARGTSRGLAPPAPHLLQRGPGRGPVCRRVKLILVDACRRNILCGMCLIVEKPESDSPWKQTGFMLFDVPGPPPSKRGGSPSAARRTVRSTQNTAFSLTIWRKRGPDGDYTWEVERVWSVKLEHSTVVSCVRTCSKTPRLSCVPEGGPFFAAAAPAGARAPLKTIERYAFLKVRSAAAPVPVARKSLIFHCFALPLENREENNAFCAFARWSLPLFHWKC